MRAAFFRIFPAIALFAAACGDDPQPPSNDPLEITTATLPAGRVGVAYDASIAARGGDTTKYTWSISAGTLPDGLTLGTSGASVKLSGTPEAEGNFSFTVQVEDGKGTKETQALMLRIDAEEVDPLIITTASVASGLVGEAYDVQLAASGGSGSGYRWSVASGDLPGGLALDESGRISGTPTAEGSFQFIVRVTDSDDNTAERTYTIAVDLAPVPLSIDTPNLPSGPIGTAYEVTLVATGGSGEGYSWSAVEGALPAGLTLSRGGVISGVPTATTTATFTVRVTDSEANTAERELSITITAVGQPLMIITEMLPDGRVGESYEAFMIRATGGTSNGFTWSVVEGTLPPGLILETNGTPMTNLLGTPAQEGDFNFTIEVRDSAGQTGRRAFSIHVEPAFIPVHIVTTMVPRARVNEQYQATLTAADGEGIGYNWLVTGGALPPGLSLQMAGTPSTVITGVPTRSGTFTATVTVFDTNNDTDTQVLVFEVDGPAIPVEIITTSLANAGFGVAYEEAVTATAGSAFGYSWSISQGALPAGLTIDAAGTPSTRIRGTPTASGQFNFTVRVEDSSGGADTQAFTINVGNALTIATLELPPPYTGRTYTATITGGGGSNTGFVWSITQGSLPPGLTFSGNGAMATISGTPTQSGLYEFEVELRDSSNTVTRQTYTLRVAGQQRFAAIVGDIQVDNDVGVFVIDLSTQAPGAQAQVSPLTGDANTSSTLTKFSPDNTKIAFRHNANGPQELYVADLSGPTPFTAVRASGPLVASGAVSQFGWSPDSRWLVYEADQDTDTVTELYIVDVSGPTPGPSIKVSGPMVTGGDIQGEDWGFSPDSTKLWYIADQEIDTALWLYVVNLFPAPSAPQRVNPAPQTANSDVVAASVSFTADSNRLVFVSDHATVDLDELWMADVSGPTPATPISLSGVIQPSGDIAGSDTVMSPDGNWVAFIGDVNTEAVSELFLVDVSDNTPPPATLISGPMVTNGDAQMISWAPDSMRLMYLADQETDSVIHVYMVGVGGALPASWVRVSAPMPSTAATVLNTGNGFIWSPDGSWVAYRADTQADGAYDLFVVPIGANGPSAPAFLLNGPNPTDGDIVSMYFSPDSTRIIGRGDNTVNNRTDLYLWDLTTGTPGPRVDLVIPQIAAGNVDAEVYWFGNDRVIFFADYSVDGVFNAYYLNPAQPNVVNLLHAPLPPSGDVSALLLQNP